MELILDLQTESYWAGITLPMLEEVRVRLRNLIKFLDKGEAVIVYTDFDGHHRRPYANIRAGLCQRRGDAPVSAEGGALHPRSCRPYHHQQTAHEPADHQAGPGRAGAAVVHIGRGG